jgi:hypothetical protein
VINAESADVVARNYKKNNGRPTIFMKDVLDKLEYVFTLGGTDKEACLYANVSPAALYKYQEKNREFEEGKEMLKEAPVLAAPESIIKHLRRNPGLALKYLERRKRDEFAQYNEMTGASGGPITLARLVLDASNALED